MKWILALLIKVNGFGRHVPYYDLRYCYKKKIRFRFSGVCRSALQVNQEEVSL